MKLPIYINSLASGVSTENGSFVSTDCEAQSRQNQLGLPRTRFVANSSIAPSDIALTACKASFLKAGISVSEIDYVISCTETPDCNNPGLVSFLLGKLGAPALPGLEIKQLSAGPIYGLSLAGNLLRSGAANMVLLLGTDILTRYFAEFSESGCSADLVTPFRTFADGGASCFISKNKVGAEFEILDHSIGCDGDGSELFTVLLPSASRFPQRFMAADLKNNLHLHRPRLKADQFLVMAVQRISQEIKVILERNAIAQTQIRVFHHATVAGESQALANELEINLCDIKDISDTNGYCGSAGPLQILYSYKDEVKSGEYVVLSAFSGSSYGVSLLRRA